MSMRPRPVTATVTKPPWMRHVSPDRMAYATRHSLDSTGSTASLISVLDHDSYVSAPSEDEEERKLRRKVEKMKVAEANSEEANKEHYDEYVSTRTQSEPNLTPWERWLIQKTKEEREMKKTDARKKRQEREKKEEEERQKEIMKRKSEEKRLAWMEQKNYEFKLQQQQEKQKQQNKTRQKEVEEQELRSKCERKFSEWMEEKKRKAKETARKERQKKREEKMAAEERRAKAELSYKGWYEKAKKRPRSVPNSFGYLSGKLTGYHDMAAYPVPSFYNPIPWQPPAVPKTKSEGKTKAKKKHAFDPNKYY